MTQRLNTTVLIAAIALVVNMQASAQLPDPGLAIDPERTALVVTDPQNDFLNPDGVTWGVVGKSVTDNRTVENIEALFKAAKESGISVFVSPHYYYEHDHRWKFEGALEALMHQIGMFDRKDALNLEGFEGSGADWLERYKPYIEDGETVVVSPHKLYGPESNDLGLQLRKRGIDKIILAGMSANLCTESHMRELVEQGFEVAAVSDATAAAVLPEYDGYQAALVNFRMIASDVWKTDEAVQAMQAAAAQKRANAASATRRPRLVSHQVERSRAYLGARNLPASGLALQGFSPVSYFSKGRAEAGNPRFKVEHDGATYYLTSVRQVEQFKRNPNRYEPAYGGWCAFGMAIQDKFPIDPTKFKVVNGKLLLFLNNDKIDALELWEQGNEAEYVRKADAHWKKVSGV
jgi:nicotinamidase-related amidase/YHS domain-containing protein